MLIVRQDIVLNSVPLERIVPHLERQAAAPGRSEVMQLLIHEQYFYPQDRHYLRDFRARVERAVEWVTSVAASRCSTRMDSSGRRSAEVCS